MNGKCQTEFIALRHTTSLVIQILNEIVMSVECQLKIKFYINKWGVKINYPNCIVKILI